MKGFTHLFTRLAGVFRRRTPIPTMLDLVRGQETSPHDGYLNLLAEAERAGMRGLTREQIFGMKIPGYTYGKKVRTWQHVSPDRREFIELLYRKAGRTVLDLGCGTGNIGKLLSDRRVTGVDTNHARLEEARKNGEETLEGDIRHLSFLGDRTFESAVLNQVIEHVAIDDLVPMLKQLSRYVTRNVLLSTPNSASMPFVAAHDLMPLQLSYLGHRTFFTPKLLENLLADCFPGAKKITVVPFGRYAMFVPNKELYYHLAAEVDLGGASRPETVKTSAAASSPTTDPVVHKNGNGDASLHPSETSPHRRIDIENHGGAPDRTAPRVDIMDGVCDIIVPVKDQLHAVRHCLESVAHFTTVPYRLVIVNDGSDDVTGRYLKDFTAQDRERRVLIENPANIGFVKSCNRAMKASHGEFLIILNSDTVVTPGWLEKMTACARTDPKIVTVNPLSNHASYFSIPLPQGHTVFEFSHALSQFSRRRYPRVGSCVGFCMLIKRKYLDELGLFDEIFSPGYGEESDFCYRAVSRGYEHALADDAFVYHRGKISFRPNVVQRIKEDHLEVVMARWGGLVEKHERRFRKERPLDYIKAAFPAPPVDFSLKSFPKDRSILATALYVLRTYGIKHGMARIARKLRKEVRTYLILLRNDWNRVGPAMVVRKGVFDVPGKLLRWGRKIVRQKAAPRSIATGVTHRHPSISCVPSTTMARIAETPLRIIYLAEKIKVAGGVTSFIQLVNEMTRRGHQAKIATTLRQSQDHIRFYDLYSQPYFFKDPQELIRDLPDADIVVATYWTTAYWLRDLMATDRCANPVYFVQDFEPDFYVKNGDDYDRAMETYRMPFHKIVKSRWLRDRLRQTGGDAHIIPLGLDLDIFYPRSGAPRYGHPRVLTQARPDHPRRNFEGTLRILGRVSQAIPNVEVVFFGQADLSKFKIPFTYSHAGTVTESALAELYSSCDVLLDASIYQGFGRPGLEAMACGCATVLTNQGGITDYAVHGENCFSMDPRDEEGMADAVVRLLRDPGQRDRLIANGFETVQRFSLAKEVEKTLDFFKQLVARERVELKRQGDTEAFNKTSSFDSRGFGRYT